MRHRAICHVFLAFALIGPPGVLSAPSSATAEAFLDVPPSATVQTAVWRQRMVLLRGLEGLVEDAPASASPQTLARAPATLEVSGGTRGLVRGQARASLFRVAATARPRVAAGDTLFALAQRYGTTVDAIAAANDLVPGAVLRIGQPLTIPPGKPAAAVAAANRPARRSAAAARTPAGRLIHQVRAGDTLFPLARQYGTSVEAIASANGLPSADTLRLGQRLIIPVGRPSVAAAPRAPVSAPRASSPSIAMFWPARGIITSRFGWRYRRHHDGIDIGSPWGAPIYAARSGRVIFAGWYYGYGRAVIIDNGGGMTTLYGHASRLVVRNGEIVERGQLIARVGCTGRCTGSHVHFEVRINGRPVNPLPYLR